MNAKQKRKAIALLSKDCKIQSFYLKDGKTCAIGCLGLAAGVSESHLKKLGGDNISRNTCRHLRRAITKTFGLDQSSLESIQIANDGCLTVVQRRRAVISVLKRATTQ